MTITFSGSRLSTHLLIFRDTSWLPPLVPGVVAVSPITHYSINLRRQKRSLLPLRIESFCAKAKYKDSKSQILLAGSQMKLLSLIIKLLCSAKISCLGTS